MTLGDATAAVSRHDGGDATPCDVAGRSATRQSKLDMRSVIGGICCPQVPHRLRVTRAEPRSRQHAGLHPRQLTPLVLEEEALAGQQNVQPKAKNVSGAIVLLRLNSLREDISWQLILMAAAGTGLSIAFGCNCSLGRSVSFDKIAPRSGNASTNQHEMRTFGVVIRCLSLQYPVHVAAVFRY